MSQSPLAGFRSWLGLVASAAVLFSFGCGRARRQPAAEQQTFSTAAAAANALFTALQSNDDATLLRLFGPSGSAILSSGNPDLDHTHRARFVAAYRRMHRLQAEPDGSVLLIIGTENWPFPVPLVESDDAWRFDTAAGERHILDRRIGRNELAAIRACHELVAAEREYFVRQGHVYAQRLASTAGKRDGLYWPGRTPVSPIGPRLAEAAAGVPSSRPFFGYYFRLLTAQGSAAPGGARSYLHDGRLTRGFAFLAYPAEYRNSGVMTFVVGANDVVYQQDLGPNTEALAHSIAAFDPATGWQLAEAAPRITAVAVH